MSANDPYSTPVPTFSTGGSPTLSAAVTKIQETIATKRFADANGAASGAAHLLNELMSKLTSLGL